MTLRLGPGEAPISLSLKVGNAILDRILVLWFIKNHLERVIGKG